MPASEYEGLDWRYALPCSALPDEVSDGLPGWLAEFRSLTPDQVQTRLAEGWADLPPWLRPLGDQLLGASPRSLVGGSFRAWLLVSRGPALPDLPWLDHTWCSPWTGDRQAAREFLAERGVSGSALKQLEPDRLFHRAFDEWAKLQTVLGGPSTSPPGRWESWELYLAAPNDPDLVRSWLGELGVAPEDPLVDFLIHFAGLRDSPPRFAGGFVPLQACARVEDDYPFDELPEEVQAEWRDALLLYRARSGDLLLYRPGGDVAWIEFAEASLRVHWPDLPSFVSFYGSYLATGGVGLDSYAGLD